MSATFADRFSLEDRVVVVTGGSRGLGRRIALGAADAGATVVVASRTAEKCEEAADEITARTGRPAMAYPVNVARWDELDGFVDAVYERYGRADVLVNNAGSSPTFDRASGISEHLFDAVMSLNAKGPFRLCALFGERMVEAGGGSIVNVSSVASVRPSERTLPYAAAKAAMNATTVGFAHYLGPHVRVNTVMPGPLETDIARAWDRSAVESMTQRFALKRTGSPEEVVGAVLYLASDAASYTTGATIRVDGGIP